MAYCFQIFSEIRITEYSSVPNLQKGIPRKERAVLNKGVKSSLPRAPSILV